VADLIHLKTNYIFQRYVPFKKTMNFNFVASDNFDIKNFKDIEDFVGNFPDFQTMVLNNENELKLLLQLLDIHVFREHEVNDSEFFSKYWDLSDNKLPELNINSLSNFTKTGLKNPKKKIPWTNMEV